MASLRGDDETSVATWAPPGIARSDRWCAVGAERADIERALERVGDHTVMDMAFVAGHTDPTSVIADARAIHRTP